MTSEPATSAQKVPLRRVLLWLALAAVPSGMMLSTTTHLTTDIFAMPLLWVIPLGLYLLSFSIAFADNRLPARLVTGLTWAGLLIGGGLAMVSTGSTGLVPVIVSVVLLFLVCVALHARLYDLRPAASQLTYFYLVMSAGGALGGVFTALVAPLVFDWVWEHPLLVLAAAALMPRDAFPDWRRMRGLDPGMARLGLVILVLFAVSLVWRIYGLSEITGTGLSIWMTAIGVGLCGLFLVPLRPLVVALLLGTMLAQGGLRTIEDSREGLRSRSYFGIYTVRDYPDKKLRTLAHGTTLHGEQSLDPTMSRMPLTYYGPGSGAGIAFANAAPLFGPAARLGVVGLGTGTLACYYRPGQTLTYFEIDPAVLRYSRDGTFTFIRDCAPQARVVLGDARLELAKAPRGSFDLLAIDAFSSDAIPLHLLTGEAFGVYLDALSAKGVLLVHISNRYIELEPVLAAEVRARGLAAVVREDAPPQDSEWTPSTWVMITRDPAQLGALAKRAPALELRAIKPAATRRWSDDHASILPYIQWANFLGRKE